MILEIKSGRLPCTLSRMSSGIQPLAGLFEIWLRDAGAARMGHSAEATWQTMRRDMHKASSKPTGLSQQYMQSPRVCPIGGRKQLSQRVCPDGSAQTSCKAYADNRKTQPDNSVPSSFRNKIYTKANNIMDGTASYAFSPVKCIIVCLVMVPRLDFRMLTSSIQT